MRKYSHFAAFAMLVLLCQSVHAQQQYSRYGYNSSGQYVGNPAAPSPTIIPGQHPYTPIPGQYPGGYYGNGYGYGYGGQYPYANQSGYGYYGANAYAPAYPALGAPVALPGGNFRFNVGGFSGAYWRAPSGYYYPWGAGAVYTTPPPIINVVQGSSQPTQPAVTDMLKDMSAYIEEQNTKKKFKSDDYQHLARRVRDLQQEEASFRSRNNGTLDPTDEENLRKNCAMLSGDISRRVIP